MQKRIFNLFILNLFQHYLKKHYNAFELLRPSVILCTSAVSPFKIVECVELIRKSVTLKRFTPFLSFALKKFDFENPNMDLF